MLVGRVEGEPNIRAVVQIKNNLAQFGHPKAFELMESGFKWLGDYEITADEVLGGIAPKANKLEQAKRMLRELADTSNTVQIWLRNREFLKEHWKMPKRSCVSEQEKSITHGIGNWIR